MSDPEWSPVRETLRLGTVAGMRTMSAPAAVARAAGQDRLSGIEKTPFGFLDSPTISRLLHAMAAGEMLADKYPGLLSRTSAPALLGRAVSGSLAGAALFASAGRRRTAGALLGSLSALASAFASYHLRIVAGEKTGIPDPVLGVLEDGIVLMVCARSLRKLR